MKDFQSQSLERLLATDATPFERELLGAASGEHPAPELTLAMQRALGIGPDAAPQADPTKADPTKVDPAGAPKATGGAASSWTSSTLLKVGIGAAVSAGVVIGALSLRSREPAAPPASAPAANAVGRPPEPPNPSPIVSLPAPPPGAQVPAGTLDSARELRLEIELLDRAKAALSAQQHERALQLLEQYAARFPTGTLGREAAVLRGKVRQGAKLPAAPEPATLQAPATSEPGDTSPP